MSGPRDFLHASLRSGCDCARQEAKSWNFKYCRIFKSIQNNLQLIISTKIYSVQYVDVMFVCLYDQKRQYWLLWQNVAIQPHINIFTVPVSECCFRE